MLTTAKFMYRFHETVLRYNVDETSETYPHEYKKRKIMKFLRWADFATSLKVGVTCLTDSLISYSWRGVGYSIPSKNLSKFEMIM